MSALQKALPLALTVFCGVLGGYYTFQPVLAPKDLPGEGQTKSRGLDPQSPAEAKPNTTASEKK